METKFIDDIHKDFRFIMSIGSKGSGKTTLLLAFLRTHYKLFDEIHLVIPSYNKSKLENGESQYDFIKYLPNTYIYNTYHPLISEKVLSRCDGKRKIFYSVDDATSSGIQISSDKNLIHLITTTRANKCMIWLLVHACKKILAPAIRGNCDYLICYRITNRKIVEALYEEFFSVSQFANIKEFLNFYNENVTKKRYNALFYSLYHDQIDNDILRWKIFNTSFKIPKAPEPKKSEPKKEVEHKSINLMARVFKKII